jgi:subfamily B ATP-binding cassette protein MsbA
LQCGSASAIRSRPEAHPAAERADASARCLGARRLKDRTKPRRDPGAPLPDDSGELARRLWRGWIAAHWAKIVAILAVIAVSAGSTGLYPILINEAYDAFGAKDAAMIALLPLLVAGVVIVKAATLYAQVTMTNRLATRIETDLQIALYDHLVDSDVAQLADETPAALTQRFTTDLAFIRDALTRATTNLVRDALTLVSVFAAMVWLDWFLSLFALVVLPLAVIPIGRIGKRIRRVSTTTQEQTGLMAQLVSESFGAVRIVKTYGLEGYLKGRAAAAFERVRVLKVKAADQRGRVEPTLELLGGLAVVGVLLVIGWRISTGASTVGEFTGFVSALLIAAQPLRALGSLNAVLQQGFSALRRVFDVLDRKPTVADRPGARPLVVPGGEIRFDGVVFRYNFADGTRALDGVDLVAAGGKVTAIVGRSGAGKSTMFSLVCRLFDAEAGTVRIDGTDVRDVTLSSLRRQVAVVAQDAVLFNDTIRQNIRFGRPNATDAEIEEAARQAAAHVFIMAMPDGYDTIVGDRGARLSGGERQRVTLARAFLKDAPILLLDEATSALDSESEHLIREAIARLAAGRTTLVIAHRLSTIRAADQIAVMDAGRVVETGTHDELLARGGLYARFYRLQFQDVFAADDEAAAAGPA